MQLCEYGERLLAAFAFNQHGGRNDFPVKFDMARANGGGNGFKIGRIQQFIKKPRMKIFAIGKIIVE